MKLSLFRLKSVCVTGLINITDPNMQLKYVNVDYTTEQIATCAIVAYLSSVVERYGINVPVSVARGDTFWRGWLIVLVLWRRYRNYGDAVPQPLQCSSSASSRAPTANRYCSTTSISATGSLLPYYSPLRVVHRFTQTKSLRTVGHI